MGKTNRKQNKKSRAELLALRNNGDKGNITQDGGIQGWSLLKGVLLYIVQFTTMYFVILLFLKGLKSIDLLPEENQDMQHSATIPVSSSVNTNLMKNANHSIPDQESVDGEKIVQPKIEKETFVEIPVQENGSIEVRDTNPSKDSTTATSDSEKESKGTLGSLVNYVTIAISNNSQLPDFTSPLEEYPKTLNITPELRSRFHPVIKFPTKTVLEPVLDGSSKKSMRKVKKEQYRVLDMSSFSGSSQLIHPKDQEQFRQERNKKTKTIFGTNRPYNEDDSPYTVGKYDEHRSKLYSSEMFQNEDYQIDGYDGLRTVHMAIDLGGPVGEKVHSFWNGVIHSVGYNAELGDYGYVIVIRYDLPASGTDKNELQTVWALYGHLDKSTMKAKAGQRVNKGQVIGRLGDVHENGGWRAPHVHFQLSMIEPQTHDMPGAVSLKDRSKAFSDYPDPRHILGPLY